jgi:DNA-binding CsgD family transcriptional regulator
MASAAATFTLHIYYKMMSIFYRTVFGLFVTAGLTIAGGEIFAQVTLAMTANETGPVALLVATSLTGQQNRWAVYAGLLSAGTLGVFMIVLQVLRYRRNKRGMLGQQAPSELTLINIQLKERQWQDALERRDMELELRDLELRLSIQELDCRNKELTTYALHMAQKNSMLEELRQCIQEIGLTQKEASPKFKRLTRLIDYSFNLDKDWEEFKLCFERVHQDFFKHLKEQYPSLSVNELRLCALLKLNLSVKEMSSLMGISPESVKMARHRLRKKLDLTSEQNLVEFMLATTRLKSSNYTNAFVC